MTLATPIANPLELPEIRNVVGHYLARRDLVQCLRVSKSWHYSFLPFVWSAITVKDKYAYPSVKNLTHHHQFVKDLAYHTDRWPEYSSTVCHNLTSLHIECDQNASPIIVAQYDRLRYLSVRSKQSQSRFQHQPVWKPVSHLQNLSSLRLYDMDIEGRDTVAFWDLCTRLKSLSMTNIHVSGLAAESVIFNRLQSLSLALRSPIKIECQLDWMAQCPNLVSLCWRPLEDQLSDALDALSVRIMENTWPNLSKLQFKRVYPSDEQLSQIISGIKKVKSLTDVGSGFGLLSLVALRPHYQGLRKLDIGTVPSMSGTGAIVPKLLASCVNLEDLSVGKVMSQDILQGRRWVCDKSLRALSVCIIISPAQDIASHQQHVLERMSHLKNLERLKLFAPGLIPDPMILDLRLGKGLELLGTLKKLRTLILHNYRQHMKSADVEWMIANWKNLADVEGHLNPEKRELDEMLLRAGIRYCRRR
ncbi:hypothetical protein B0O80DRAFT_472940 [Mortierella sp. GBAus27b]|nr:hypothetical protein B0O80DRAFT_472940 [Mortierella sp. GBAus27b]